MMGKVFVNYRREDAKGEALALRTVLAAKLPRTELFMDVDGGIAPGDNFVRALDERVRDADVFLCLIGPKWVAVTDQNGRRRLDNPDDFVRIEIASALKRDLPILPILIDDTRMPPEAELPEAIRLISYKQAMRLRHDRFNSDADGIAGAIKDVLAGPKSAGAPRWAMVAAVVGALAVGAASGLYSIRFFPGQEAAGVPGNGTEFVALRKKVSALESAKREAEAKRDEALAELEANSKDAALQRLARQIAELTSLLSLETGKTKAATTEIEDQRRIASDALAKVDLLNQQTLALRRQLTASETKGK